MAESHPVKVGSTDLILFPSRSDSTRYANAKMMVSMISRRWNDPPYIFLQIARGDGNVSPHIQRVRTEAFDTKLSMLAKKNEIIKGAKKNFTITPNTACWVWASGKNLISSLFLPTAMRVRRGGSCQKKMAATKVREGWEELILPRRASQK